MRGRRSPILSLPGMPHLGSGISWQWQGKTVMATPNLNGVISIIDMATWKTVKQIKTRGPGFFMQPRKQPLRLDRSDDEQGIQGHHADHRQGTLEIVAE